MSPSGTGHRLCHRRYPGARYQTTVVGSVHRVQDEPDQEPAEAVALEVASDPIATAKRRHGATGAILAAGMFGVDIALGRKPKEEAPIVVAAPTEPTDIDDEGIHIPIDDRTAVYAPPQPPADPFPPRRPRARARK